MSKLTRPKMCYYCVSMYDLEVSHATDKTGSVFIVIIAI